MTAPVTTRTVSGPELEKIRAEARARATRRVSVQKAKKRHRAEVEALGDTVPRTGPLADLVGTGDEVVDHPVLQRVVRERAYSAGNSHVEREEAYGEAMAWVAEHSARVAGWLDLGHVDAAKLLYTVLRRELWKVRREATAQVRAWGSMAEAAGLAVDFDEARRIAGGYGDGTWWQGDESERISRKRPRDVWDALLYACHDPDSPMLARLLRRHGLEGEGLGAFGKRSIDRLSALVGALPDKDRELLAAKYGEGLTQAEIADRLGVSQPAVSQRLAAVVDRVTRQFEAPGEDDTRWKSSAGADGTVRLHRVKDQGHGPDDDDPHDDVAPDDGRLPEGWWSGKATGARGWG